MPTTSSNSYTITNLRFLTSYNFTVRAEVRFTGCGFVVLGVDSDPIMATPQETRKKLQSSLRITRPFSALHIRTI